MASLAENKIELPPIAERVPTLEQALELPPQKADEPLKEPEAMVFQPIVSSPAASATPIIELDKQIESVLEEDLRDLFMQLPPADRQAFKVHGEEIGRQIKTLLAAVKVQARTIWQLIKEWLTALPGVNKFFIEQEAKIKTDKILGLKPGLSYE